MDMQELKAKLETDRKNLEFQKANLIRAIQSAQQGLQQVEANLAANSGGLQAIALLEPAPAPTPAPEPEAVA